MEKKNVLVTGGAGFIGSFLCEALLREGNRVICVDDISTGSLLNIDALLRNPDFQFLRLNINEPFQIEAFSELDPFKVKFVGIQEIYHFAMPTSVKNFEKYRMHAVLSNAVGIKHVLDVAVKYKAKFLLASSATIYGSHADHGMVKEDVLGVFDHLNPRGCFNEGKRFAETMTVTYADTHGLDAKIARIFRTYGPRMPLFHGHQIPDFVLNVLDEEPIVIAGDEKSATSLTYVTDVVDGVMRLMKAERGIGPVNIGNDADVIIADVAKKIMELAGVTVPIQYEPQPPHMIPLALPALQKAREKLGWIPLVRMDDGLRKTIDYIRANKVLLTRAS
jgi:nucleoside-diphosphate-sugar epimerase